MPNIDNLIDTIQQNLNTSASQETTYFSTLDLKYAYSRLKLDPETARHCNLVYKCLKKLDEDSLRINLPKCQFCKNRN